MTQEAIRVREYRLIPASIEAVQLTAASNWETAAAWCGGRVTLDGIWVPGVSSVAATYGDYIVHNLGTKRYHVMKAPLFKKTFRQYGMRQDGFDFIPPTESDN